MRTEEKLTDNKFVNLKQVKHPEKNVGCYQFAERLGVDSIAFICYDKASGKFLVNKEYKPPVDQFVSGAFGGSMDKAQKPIDIAIGEIKEEAGFSVKASDVYSLGSVFVSTQMNQFCMLFLAIVDASDQGEKEPENAIEAMATTRWITYDDVMALQDWKAITIVAKAKDRNIIPGR